MWPATLLLLAGCLLVITLMVWTSKRSARAGEAAPHVDEFDQIRLGLGPRWDPYHPEATVAHRMRAARQQATETRQRADYYSLLRIGPGATDAEIERAFRSRVIEVHPDRFVGDPAAQERAATTLRQLNEAVGILRDPLARARYDAGRPPRG